MDEYLKDHLVIKFFLILISGFVLFVFSYFIYKSYNKEKLVIIKTDAFRIMVLLAINSRYVLRDFYHAIFFLYAIRRFNTN